MPELKIYHPSEKLPAGYECQIRSVIRMLWHDKYVYDLDAPLDPPERDTHHVVIVERHALLSHARVNCVNLAHEGETYRIYCLGDVFTYPAFRKNGYGQQVVEAGTNIILSDADADVAILFTDPELEKFYAQSGWKYIPGMNATKGDAEEPVLHEGAFVMMMFLSDKAKQHRADFKSKFLHLPGYGW